LFLFLFWAAIHAIRYIFFKIAKKAILKKDTASILVA
jgi:hypothetical protein